MPLSLCTREGGVRINQFIGVRGSTVIRAAFVRSPRNGPGNKARSAEFVRVTTALRLRSDADDTESFAQSLRPSSSFLARRRRARFANRSGILVLVLPFHARPGSLDGVVHIQEAAAMRERSRPLAGTLPVVPRVVATPPVILNIRFLS